MKKRLFSIMAIAMVFGVLYGCSSAKASETKTETTAAETTAEAAAEESKVEIVEETESEAEPMAGMPNPMAEVTADELLSTTGISFNVPEDAENVKYFVINGEIGEIDYVQYGADITGRMTMSDEFKDISGMYYEWDVEENGKVHHCDAKFMRHIDDDQTVDVCLWYDVVPGIMYSVTAAAPDLDGFDVQAVAEQLFPVAQGEVG